MTKSHILTRLQLLSNKILNIKSLLLRPSHFSYSTFFFSQSLSSNHILISTTFLMSLFSLKLTAYLFFLDYFNIKFCILKIINIIHNIKII